MTDVTDADAADNIDVDVDFADRNTREQVMQKYMHAMQQLRELAEEAYNVRPFYFDNLVLTQFFQFQQRASGGYLPPFSRFKVEVLRLRQLLDRRRQILCWLFYLLLAVLCVFAYRYETGSNPAEQIEDAAAMSMYSGKRAWRRLTLPLIQRFPRLTEFYDESCLIANPFFQITDTRCEPCANVQSVLETQSLSGVSETAASVPLLIKTNQKPTQLEDFFKIYATNMEIFQRDAYRVQSTNPEITNLEHLFSHFNHTLQDSKIHTLWRCNRLLPARLLRKVIARPAQLPDAGVALERHVAIDAAKAPAYALPETECATVYVQQVLGSRFIILRPTSECRHRCRTLSLRLPQSFVLSYNWWYWKPVSVPDPMTDMLSMSLIGSYC